MTEVQVDGKDGAIEPSGVVESLERKITSKHLVGGALHSGTFGAAYQRCLAEAQSSLEAVHPGSRTTWKLPFTNET